MLWRLIECQLPFNIDKLSIHRIDCAARWLLAPYSSNKSRGSSSATLFSFVLGRPLFTLLSTTVGLHVEAERTFWRGSRRFQPVLDIQRSHTIKIRVVIFHGRDEKAWTNHCLLCMSPQRSSGEEKNENWDGGKRVAPSETYVGSDFMHHQFVNIAKMIQVSIADSSFSAVPRRTFMSERVPLQDYSKLIKG